MKWSIFITCLLISTLLVSNPLLAQFYESQDSTYKIQFDNTSDGYAGNNTRSEDQAGDNILIGSFEAYDIGSGNSDGSTFKFKSGLQPTFEANVSGVALLSPLDGIIELYDSLLFAINPNGNPTSSNGARFAVQISSDTNFSSYNYINPTNFSPDIVTNADLSIYYQPCAQTDHLIEDATRWDCGTVPGMKKYLTGLSHTTQYCVRVVTLNGDATNSEPGPSLCATTYSSGITFTISTNQSNFGVLSTTSVNTATPATILSSSTNATNGYVVRVIGTGNGSGAVSGLYSSTSFDMITSTSGNLDATIGTNGYGLQTAIITGIGEVNLDNAWDPSLFGRNSTFVGQIMRTATDLYSSPAPNITTHQVSVTYKANLAPSIIPANDYSDSLTYSIVANW